VQLYTHTSQNLIWLVNWWCSNLVSYSFRCGMLFCSFVLQQLSSVWWQNILRNKISFSGRYKLMPTFNGSFGTGTTRNTVLGAGLAEYLEILAGRQASYSSAAFGKRGTVNIFFRFSARFYFLLHLTIHYSTGAGAEKTKGYQIQYGSYASMWIKAESGSTGLWSSKLQTKSVSMIYDMILKELKWDRSAF